MVKEKLSFSLQQFLRFNTILFILFFLLRIYEYGLLSVLQPLPESALKYELVGLWYDLIFVLTFSAVILVPYVLLYFFSRSLANIFYSFALLSLCIIYIGFIQYFAETFTLLGADFWGYSYDDILITINSSGGFSILALLPFVFFILVFFFVLNKLPDFALNGYLLSVFCILMMATLFLNPILKAKSKFFSTEVGYTLAVNKADFFIEKSVASFIKKKKHTNIKTQAIDIAENPYPFEHTAKFNDVLGPYFNISEQRPNLVFIVVESLGRTFVGPNAEYGGCTPFLDSLVEQSIFFENFLSTTGRTFGVLPSIFASLPYGANGFMEMGTKQPNHTSLIKLLKHRNYYTSYFYGGDISFDLQDVFLETEKTDYILDENKFTPKYKKLVANSGGFTWGYGDDDLFKRSLEIIQEREQKPRLDMYLTLTTHEPFPTPNEFKYNQKFEKLVKDFPDDKREKYREYTKQFSSLVYLDESIEKFINAYKKRSDFNNTIFFITGDHRMIPIPHKNKIDRFRVPFIIYSPLIKKPVKIASVSSHQDVTPSIVAFLKNNYNMNFPLKEHWLGQGIDTTVAFKNNHSLAFMRNKNEMVDYLDGDFFLSDGELFKIKPNLGLERWNDDELQEKISNKLEQFRSLNKYVCDNNKLYDDTLSSETIKPEFVFTAQEEIFLEKTEKRHLNPDQYFLLAREKAFAGDRTTARLMCKKILQNKPNYNDARILMGRTFAWDNNYTEAKKCFKEVLRRQPNYEDAYQALIDAELWSNNPEEAIKLANKALTMFKDNKEILEKKNKAQKLLKSNRTKELSLNNLNN